MRIERRRTRREMSEAAKRPWPTEIRLDPGQDAADGGLRQRRAVPSWRRNICAWNRRSAEVQGHGAGQKQIVTGKADVKIAALEPVGNYALRIRFDDGHDTGLYSWDYLHASLLASTAQEMGDL